MSLERKLKPARKAWKAFTYKLRSNFHNLDLASSVKATARRVLDFCSLRLFTPFKRRFLARRSDERRRRRRYDVLEYRDRSQFESNFRAIYIDRLYGEPVVSEKHYLEDVQAGTSRGSGREEVGGVVGLKRRAKTKEVIGEQRSDESGPSMDEAWKAVVAASPHLRVDEKAEEFIGKFRQEMNLAKEKSLAEFQEMLARGS